MKLSERRKQLREDLVKRTQESFNRKDDSGMFTNIINPDLDIPEWKVAEGKHVINVLPYEVGQNHPDKKMKPGDIDYLLDLWVHKNVGTNQDQILCLSKTYKQKCPICEHRRSLMDEGADKEVYNKDPLKAKRMVLYNIWVMDDAKSEAKGVQVLYIAHFLMEKNLIELVESAKGGGKVEMSFADLEIGKEIAFKREGMGKDNTRYLGYRLMDRKYAIPDEIVDSVYCLDEIIHIPTYDEVASIYYGEVKEKEVGTNGLQEEPEPAQKTFRKQPLDEQQENPCPANGAYGVDLDKLDDCVDCKQYKGCALEAEEIEAKARASRRIRR